ncbi:MAG: SAM-dependent methyltransferase, partial [Flavobacteriia bacterium]|nr:SAM-dependent methyltransferase [Flavobacteriia bacterium]
QIRQFIVENQSSALGFLRWVQHPVPDFERIHRIVNKKTPDHEVFSLVELLKHGDVGLFSETGAPAVADPGSMYVRFAHDMGYNVVPLPGPSSILLALMASGMNGQHFEFHGYVPVDQDKRKESVRKLEQESRQHLKTQIWIETPHRTGVLLEDTIKVCQSDTRLAVAASLTTPDEMVISKKISDWSSRDKLTVEGKPAVFLLQAV